MRSLLLGTAMLAGMVPVAARAQDAAVSQVTVTATRVPTPLDQIGSSVSVVTAQQIRDEQLSSLPEVLQTVPGLNVVQTGGPGGATSVFMRGTNSNHVKVLVDGIDVSDTASTSGTFDFAHLLTSDVERVEVLRGPQGGLYGSDAIGGVINVITREGSGPLEVRASAEGGSFDTDQESAGVSGQANGFHYAVDVQHLRAGATPVTPLDLLASGERRIDDAYDNLTFSTRLGLDLSKDLDLGFVARTTQSQLRYTGDDFSTFPSFPTAQQSENRSQQYYARGYVRLSLLDGRLEQTAGLAYSSDKRVELSWPSTIPDIQHGSRTKLDWRADVHPATGETVTLGAEHEEERYLSPILAATGISSGYAQLQSQIGDFSNAADVRYDSNSRFGAKATFRIAPSFLIGRLGLQLKGSYGTGFKAPSLDELFHSYPAFGFFANPNLRPETSRGWDIGFEEHLDGGKASFGATYFHNRIRDLIDENATFTSLINLGRATTYGVESFAAYAPTRTLALRVDYTYTRARDDPAAQELLRRPRHKLDVQADWRPQPRLQLSGALVYVGSWIDANRDFTISRLAAPGYLLVNLAASYQVVRDVAVFGRITNLGDTRYENPTGFLGPGRGLFAGLRVSY